MVFHAHSIATAHRVQPPAAAFVRVPVGAFVLSALRTVLLLP